MEQHPKLAERMHRAGATLEAAEQVDAEVGVADVVHVTIEHVQAAARVEPARVPEWEAVLEIAVEPQACAIVGEVDVERRVELQAVHDRHAELSA
jgi:hypothetical protein